MGGAVVEAGAAAGAAEAGAAGGGEATGAAFSTGAGSVTAPTALESSLSLK